MLWQVEVETASPDDGMVVQKVLGDSARLLGHDATTADADDGGWVMQFEIDACDPMEAPRFAMIRISLCAPLSRLPAWRIVAMRVLDAEFAYASCQGFESS